MLCIRRVHVKRALPPCFPLAEPVCADKREKTAEIIRQKLVTLWRDLHLLWARTPSASSSLHDPCKGKSSFRPARMTETVSERKSERKKSLGTMCDFKLCPVCTVRFSESIQSLARASSSVCLSVTLSFSSSSLVYLSFCLITYFYYTFSLSLFLPFPAFLPCLLSMHSLLSLPHFDIFICPAKAPGSLACIHSYESGLHSHHSLHCFFNTKCVLHKGYYTILHFRKFGVCVFWGEMTPHG